MPQKLTSKPKFDFKVETAEVQKKKQGVLFYVIPPLLVLGVFVYCIVKSPEKTAAPVVHYSTTAQPVADEELYEEEEEEEEETGEGETSDE